MRRIFAGYAEEGLKKGENWTVRHPLWLLETFPIVQYAIAHYITEEVFTLISTHADLEELVLLDIERLIWSYSFEDIMFSYLL
jgi:hypothetical protein